MLPVSDILEVALGNSDAQTLMQAHPARYTQQAPVIVWNITNQCNMACPHCYSAAKYKKPVDDLTESQARRVVDRLAEDGVRILIVSGGEPLLRPDVFDILEYATKCGLSCQLSTNGVLLTDETVRNLVRCGVQYAGVSIDGLAAFNDKYRCYDDGFQQALDGLRRARDAGLKTGLRMTVTERNQDHLGALIDLAAEESFDRFYLSHLLYEGRGAGFAKEDLRHAACRKLVEALFQKAGALLQQGAKLRIVTGGNDADGVFLYHFCKRRFGDEIARQVYDVLEERGGNSAGEKILNIDHRGEVHPDQFWRSLSLGNILDHSLSQIFEHEMARALRTRVTRLSGRCGECRYVQLCRGSHRERALQVFGEVWGPDPACYLDDSEVAGAEQSLTAGEAGG